VSENWQFISNTLTPTKEYALSSFKLVRGVISELEAFNSIFTHDLLELLVVSINTFCFV
jgi:hypothetical protein